MICFSIVLSFTDKDSFQVDELGAMNILLRVDTEVPMGLTVDYSFLGEPGWLLVLWTSSASLYVVSKVPS